jgi:leucyl-tRNA synthetase
MTWADDMRELRLREVEEAGDNVRRRWLANKAYEMRLAPTLGESAMQIILDETEYRWYPQYILGRYIVDFFCPPLSLFVEVDGTIHANQQERDAIRQNWLVEHGYNGFRITNKDLMVAPDQVAEQLADWMWELAARKSA